jgi:hypothetical protein
MEKDYQELKEAELVEKRKIHKVKFLKQVKKYTYKILEEASIQ